MRILIVFHVFFNLKKTNEFSIKINKFKCDEFSSFKGKTKLNKYEEMSIHKFGKVRKTVNLFSNCKKTL